LHLLTKIAIIQGWGTCSCARGCRGGAEGMNIAVEGRRR